MKPSLGRLALFLFAAFALLSAGGSSVAGELDWPHVPGQLLVNFHTDVDPESIDLVNGLMIPMSILIRKLPPEPKFDLAQPG